MNAIRHLVSSIVHYDCVEGGVLSKSLSILNTQLVEFFLLHYGDVPSGGEASQILSIREEDSLMDDELDMGISRKVLLNTARYTRLLSQEHGSTDSYVFH